MSELDRSIVTWTKLKSIYELSDGFILYSIMNRINPELFEIDSGSRKCLDTFSQKYASLNKLKQRLETHFKVQLKSKPPSEIADLNKIAKLADKKNLFVLIENVVEAILMYENKEVFISAILNLDIRVQSELMEFITKILKKKDLRAEDEQEDVKRENLALKLQIEELQVSLQEIVGINDVLMHEKQEIFVKMRGLEEKLEARSARRRPSEANLQYLEGQMNQKDAIIHELMTGNLEIKKKFEDEVEALQEELDNVNERLKDYNKVRSDMELYKKRAEDLSGFKTKVKDLEVQNQRLRESLKIQEKETDHVLGNAKNARALKNKAESLASECENLKKALTEAEKLKKNALREKKELEDSKNYFEQQCRELTSELNRCNSKFEPGDELSSLQRNITEDYYDEIKRLKTTNQRLLVNAGIISGLNSQLDSIISEKTLISKELEEEIKAKQNAFRQIEEQKKHILSMDGKIKELYGQMAELGQNNAKLVGKIQKLNRSIDDAEKQNIELNRWKETSVGFKKELKEIYTEKSELYVKIQEIKDELYARNNEIMTKNLKINVMENEIHSKDQELVRTKERLEELVIYRKNSELEAEFKVSEAEYSKLKAQVKRKKEIIEKLLKENRFLQTETEALIDNKLKSEFSFYNKEIDKLHDKLARNTEKVKELERFKLGLTNSWKQEMQFVSMMIHDVGMECVKAGQLLKKHRST